MRKFRIVQHGFAGTASFAGWLFSLGYLHLGFWNGLLAIVLWPSFLAAAVETMFFFAIFDPVDIGEGTALAALVANHNAGYALGFFFFWAFTTLSGALSLYLVRTETELRRTGSGSHGS